MLNVFNSLFLCEKSFDLIFLDYCFIFNAMKVM